MLILDRPPVEGEWGICHVDPKIFLIRRKRLLICITLTEPSEALSDSIIEVSNTQSYFPRYAYKALNPLINWYLLKYYSDVHLVANIDQHYRDTNIQYPHYSLRYKKDFTYNICDLDSFISLNNILKKYSRTI